ncbi:hypothetical protein PR048_017441 [Dryococelus australis]|uniref:Uncharacterized protein n=1 Tax=Dryococelus australis TaxID=614101 RepID=A0ABQ9H9J2_9NEOP|nr:hypothetical protein PR048_017441 [Dryococelus australis]
MILAIREVDTSKADSSSRRRQENANTLQKLHNATPSFKKKGHSISSKVATVTKSIYNRHVHVTNVPPPGGRHYGIRQALETGHSSPTHVNDVVNSIVIWVILVSAWHFRHLPLVGWQHCAHLIQSRVRCPAHSALRGVGQTSLPSRPARSSTRSTPLLLHELFSISKERDLAALAERKIFSHEIYCKRLIGAGRETFPRAANNCHAKVDTIADRCGSGSLRCLELSYLARCRGNRGYYTAIWTIRTTLPRASNAPSPLTRKALRKLHGPQCSRPKCTYCKYGTELSPYHSIDGKSVARFSAGPSSIYLSEAHILGEGAASSPRDRQDRHDVLAASQCTWRGQRDWHSSPCSEHPPPSAHSLHHRTIDKGIISPRDLPIGGVVLCLLRAARDLLPSTPPSYLPAVPTPSGRARWTTHTPTPSRFQLSHHCAYIKNNEESKNAEYYFRNPSFIVQLMIRNELDCSKNRLRMRWTDVRVVLRSSSALSNIAGKCWNTPRYLYSSTSTVRAFYRLFSKHEAPSKIILTPLPSFQNTVSESHLWPSAPSRPRGNAIDEAKFPECERDEEREKVQRASKADKVRDLGPLDVWSQEARLHRTAGVMGRCCGQAPKAGDANAISTAVPPPPPTHPYLASRWVAPAINSETGGCRLRLSLIYIFTLKGKLAGRTGNQPAFYGTNSTVPQDSATPRQGRNEGTGETGDPRPNPPTSGNVQHDLHMPGIEPAQVAEVQTSYCKDPGSIPDENMNVVLFRDVSLSQFLIYAGIRTYRPKLDSGGGGGKGRTHQHVALHTLTSLLQCYVSRGIRAEHLSIYKGVAKTQCVACKNTRLQNGWHAARHQRFAASIRSSRDRATNNCFHGHRRSHFWRHAPWISKALPRTWPIVRPHFLISEGPVYDHLLELLSDDGYSARPATTLHRTHDTITVTRQPPTKATRVQSTAGSLDFRKWESCRTMPLVGGFSRGSPVCPPLHYSAAPYSRQSISSALKTSMLRGPNLFTNGIVGNIGICADNAEAARSYELRPACVAKLAARWRHVQTEAYYNAALCRARKRIQETRTNFLSTWLLQN